MSGRRSIEATLPEDARDLLQRAEKLVFLFPEDFDTRTLVADQTAGDGALVFDFETLVSPESDAAPSLTHTFVGRLGEIRFAVEVRQRTATIIADPFDVRRDLLLVLKEYVERRRRQEVAA